MEESKVYKRTQFLVDRTYQIRFVTRLFVAILTIAIVSSLIAMGILWQNMYKPELEQQIHIISACIGVAVTLLVELLISIPIIYYLGIRQSHRVVGPIKRITKTLEAVTNGDYSQRLSLRRGDVLETLANAINQMSESLQKRNAR